jgi:hypothetical protein
MKNGYAVFAYSNSPQRFLNTLGLLENYYLLKTSFKALAGKNFTFCDAAI